MDEIIKDLNKLKEEIDEAKKDEIRLDERQKGLSNRLRNEFNCRSIDDAEKKIISIKKRRETVDEKIKTDYQKLKNDFEW